jgi:hypothetical protein
VDIAAVFAAVQVDEDITLPRAVAAATANIERRGKKVVVDPPGDEGMLPLDLTLEQRRDNVPLRTPEDVDKGFRRIVIKFER